MLTWFSLGNDHHPIALMLFVYMQSTCLPDSCCTKEFAKLSRRRHQERPDISLKCAHCLSYRRGINLSIVNELCKSCQPSEQSRIPKLLCTLYSETCFWKLFRFIQKLCLSYSEPICLYSETSSLYSETIVVVFRNYFRRIEKLFRRIQNLFPCIQKL